MSKVDKSYVSLIDKFLQEYVKTHTKTLSENREIQKYQRLAELRDNPDAYDLDDEIWEGFYK